MSIYGTQREAGTPVTKWSNLSVLVEKQEDVHILWIKLVSTPHCGSTFRIGTFSPGPEISTPGPLHSQASTSQSGSVLLGTSVLPSPAKLRIPTPELFSIRISTPRHFSPPQPRTAPDPHPGAVLNPDQYSSALQSSPAPQSSGSPPRSCSQSGSVLLGTSVLPSPAQPRIPTPELFSIRISTPRHFSPPQPRTAPDPHPGAAPGPARNLSGTRPARAAGRHRNVLLHRTP
ncbi:hypothetical protein Bbelb_110200 [Branchiostoma belcheri]|nr:hypothetical protein Bbelb_110200 [Branchiostoma belcheri]